MAFLVFFALPSYAAELEPQIITPVEATQPQASPTPVEAIQPQVPPVTPVEATQPQASPTPVEAIQPQVPPVTPVEATQSQASPTPVEAIQPQAPPIPEIITLPQELTPVRSLPKVVGPTIYIAKITGGEYSTSSDIQQAIAEALNKELEKEPSLTAALNIHLLPTPIPITDSNQIVSLIPDQTEKQNEGAVVIFGEQTSSPDQGEQLHLKVALLKHSQDKPYLLAMSHGFTDTPPASPTLPHQIVITLPALKEFALLERLIRAWGLSEKEKWHASTLAFDALLLDKTISPSGIGGILYYAAWAEYWNYMDTREVSLLEKAIRLFDQAAEAHRVAQDFHEYARVQLGLGICYRTLAATGVASGDHLRRAVSLIQEAVRLLKNQKNETDAMAAQNILGVTYQDLALLKLEPEQNLNFSLSVLNGLFPKQGEVLKPVEADNGAIVKNNMSLAHQALAFWGIAPEQHLKKSIDLLQGAMEAKEYKNEMLHAMSQGNIGLGYQGLALWGVEPISSLNASNEVLKTAIALWEKQNNRPRYAVLYGSLGANYQSLASWGVQPEQNLNLSVETLLKAASLLKELQNRFEYSGIQANLGVSYQMLAVRGIHPAENFTSAIAVLKEAAIFWKEQNDRAGFVNAKNNMGVCYLGLVRLGVDTEKNQALADESFKEARTREPKAVAPSSPVN
ncbi:MAG: hypothetical protein AAB035_05930 [Nitrospirota bacterium]